MSIENEGLKQMLKPMQTAAIYNPSRPINYEDARESAENLGNKILPGAQVNEITVAGIPCDKITAKGSREDRIVLYIHGGGFTTGTASSRRVLSTAIALSFGVDVIACNYRLAPEHPYPAAIDDCMAVYKELAVQYGAENIVVAGESAGGNLALGVAVRARLEGLPLPAALISLSPLVQYDQVFESYKENLATDFIIQNVHDEIKDAYLCTKDPETLRDPVISPYYADVTGFPPTMLSASTCEVLRDDTLLFGEKLVEANVKVKISMRDDMQHAYVLFQSLPEAREELEVWKGFMKEIGFI